MGISRGLTGDTSTTLSMGGTGAANTTTIATPEVGLECGCDGIMTSPLRFADHCCADPLGPIMHQHHHRGTRCQQLLASVLSQRFNQFAHFDARLREHLRSFSSSGAAIEFANDSHDVRHGLDEIMGTGRSQLGGTRRTASF